MRKSFIGYWLDAAAPLYENESYTMSSFEGKHYVFPKSPNSSGGAGVE